jgi:hypothetical protein
VPAQADEREAHREENQRARLVHLLDPDRGMRAVAVRGPAGVQDRLEKNAAVGSEFSGTAERIPGSEHRSPTPRGGCPIPKGAEPIFIEQEQDSQLREARRFFFAFLVQGADAEDRRLDRESREKENQRE